MNDHTTGSDSSRNISARLRIIGAIVLLIAVAGAGTAWRIDTHPAGPTMDDLLPGYSKANARQMEILYGKTGVVLSGWVDELMRPDVEGIIVAVVGLLGAFGCFYVARLLEETEEPF